MYCSSGVVEAQIDVGAVERLIHLWPERFGGIHDSSFVVVLSDNYIFYSVQE